MDTEIRNVIYECMYFLLAYDFIHTHNGPYVSETYASEISTENTR